MLKLVMGRAFIKSRDLLEAAGEGMDRDAGFPLAHRHLLITSVLEFVSSPALAKFLVGKGHEVASKTVSNWQQFMRKWLGLPAAGRG